jgi:hypothetical protein
MNTGARTGRSLEDARADLSYIRHTMEEAGTFTAISGWGLMLAGAVGTIAGFVSYVAGGYAPRWSRPAFHPFLVVWTFAAIVAAPIAGVLLAGKARHRDLPLTRGPSRRALRSVLPGWLAAVVITPALLAGHGMAYTLIPSAWLTLDGLALLSAASFSVPPVRWLGWELLLFGILAAYLRTPVCAAALLGAGFGLAHLLAGAAIARRYDG